MAAYANNVMITCSESWMLYKVCSYVVGINRANINKWRDEFSDDKLDIKYEQQDPVTMFLTVYTDNTFSADDFMNQVVAKVHDAVCRFQRTFQTECVCEITVRRDGYRSVNAYSEGRCIDTQTYKDFVQQPKYDIDTDFPSL